MENPSCQASISIASLLSITVNGAAVNPGSIIAAFYDSQGTLACGGFVFWNGMQQILTLNGDNPTTPSPDGFSPNELNKLRVIQGPSGSIFVVNPVWDSAYPDSCYFVCGGSGNLLGITTTTSASQAIPLTQGWSMWSSYIQPPSLNFPTVIMDALGVSSNAAVNSIISIMKNQNGQVYWPAFGGFCSIPFFNNQQGYASNSIVPCTLTVVGQQLFPENYALSLNLGWNMISYLRTTNGATPSMFSSGVSGINNPLSAHGAIVPWIDILKNGAGQVYWPVINLNSISNLKPGLGYQVKMRSANWTNSTITTSYTVGFPISYHYPPNSLAAPTKEETHEFQPSYFVCGLNTGSNLTLGIPEAAWEIHPQPGDEMAAINQAGEIVGSSIFEGGPSPFPSGATMYTQPRKKDLPKEKLFA